VRYGLTSASTDRRTNQVSLDLGHRLEALGEEVLRDAEVGDDELELLLRELELAERQPIDLVEAVLRQELAQRDLEKLRRYLGARLSPGSREGVSVKS